MKLRFVFTVATSVLLLLGAALDAHATLVGSYSFEEGTGTVVNDASGRNNNGTLINPLSSSWTSGHSGGGLYLPGIPGSYATYVDLGNPADFQFSNAFTFTAWVYSDAPNTDAPILAKEGSGGTAYWFGVFYNGFGVLCDFEGWWPWDFERRSVPVPTWNGWHHLASTWDGTTLNQYFDGNLVDSVPVSGALFNTSDRLTIGVNSGVWSTAFTGKLDDIHIYNNALSASEIVADMNTNPATPPVCACSVSREEFDALKKLAEENRYLLKQLPQLRKKIEELELQIK